MLLTEIRTDVEYEFLELWYSCKWVIWDRYPESIFMVSEGEVLFEQDWKNNYLFCKYSKVWSLFESKFEYNNMQINDMISGILEEHLKNGVLTPAGRWGTPQLILEEHLKNGVLTPYPIALSSSDQLEEHLKEQNTKLLHHKDTTVGLWATDRPDLIPESVKDLFFQITFDETEVVTA